MPDSQMHCRRFRFRFRLRSLLLFSAAFAVLLSFEATRARHQRQLAARLNDFGAQYKRTPRKWMPEFVGRALSPDCGESITHITVEAMQAPGKAFGLNASAVTVELVAPAEIESLCAMPAMAHLRAIQLRGNAVTDDVLDKLAALKHLEWVTFQWTAVAGEALHKWARTHPRCHVSYAPDCNGLETVARGALLITDDLSLFVRADRGEADAIRKLLHIAGNPRYERPRMLMDFLWRINTDTAIPLFREVAQSGNAATRRAVAELLGHLDQVVLLTELLDDPDTDVRVEAVLSLARISHTSARRSLLVAAKNSEPEVRVAALRELPKILGQDAWPCYAAALQDPCRDVRWQAIYAMDQTADKTGTAALIEALSDEDTRNRCAAARALGKIADPLANSVLSVTAVEDEDILAREAAKAALAVRRGARSPVEGMPISHPP